MNVAIFLAVVFALLKWSAIISWSWWWIALIWLVGTLYEGIPNAIVYHAYSKRPED